MTRLHELLGLDPNRYPEATRYAVSGVLGEGGTGSVLLGKDDKLDREVAIKLINTKGATDADVGIRFHREAKAMASLNHPNALRVIDYSGPECPTPFLVTERLVGHNLDKYIDADPLDERQVVAIMHELAGALAAAHALGIIHRDLKPANVFIERSGRVVLIDFGLAKGVTNRSGTFAAGSTALVGTPLFFSPEQCRQGPAISPATDLFSLGSMLYYAASQVLAFRGNSIPDIIDAVVETQPTPVSELIDCSPQFDALILQLLEKDPQQRPASARAVRAACAAILSAAGVMSPQDVVAELVSARPLRIEMAQPLGDLAALRARLSLPPPAFDERTVLSDVQRAETRVIEIRDHATVVKRAPKAAPTRAPTEAKRRSAWPYLAASGLVVVAAAGAWAIVSKKPSVQAQPAPIEATPEPVAAALPVPTQEGQATVRIAVKPWGEVYVDGQHKGTAPSFRAIILPLGKHEIEVRNPAGGVRTRSVELTRKTEEVLLKFDFTSE